MKAKSLVKVLKFASVVLALVICLFGSSSFFLFNSFLGPIFQELLAAIRNPQTQLLIMLCVCLYFAVFMWLQNWQSTGRFWCFSNPTVWLSGILFITTFLYAFNSSTTSQSTQVSTFLAGATLGKGASSWSAWQKQESGVIGLILNVLILLLLITSFWHFGADHGYEYRSQARWTGPWENPNIFGLFMGTGIVLTSAQIIQCLLSSVQGGDVEERSWKLRFRKYKKKKGVSTALCFFATILMGRGLLNSYSRGAWIAVISGFGYLVWHIIRNQSSARCGTCNTKSPRSSAVVQFFNWIGRNRVNVSVIIISVGVLAFWQFRHSKHAVIASRIFSVANVNDFSWLNRITSWEGALQITAEHPWLGAGWNRSESLYQYYYLPPKLDDSAAIQMNDYLMLGTTLGVPALFCFGMYLWFSLIDGSWKTGKEQIKNSDQRALFTNFQLPTSNFLSATCRAGAIVLAVGFWFDGGLFKLATASTFWILLELGAVQLHKEAGTQTNEIS